MSLELWPKMAQRINTHGILICQGASIFLFALAIVGCLPELRDKPLPSLEDPIFCGNGGPYTDPIIKSKDLVFMNEDIIREILKHYSPSACNELRARIADDKRPLPKRLLYAGILAIKGDREGQGFLIKVASRARRWDDTREAFWVIGNLRRIGDYGNHLTIPVDMRWAEEFMLQTLADNTKLDAAPPKFALPLTRQGLAMDYCEGNFGQILIEMKSEKVSSRLIDICRTSSEGKQQAISALGELKGKTAVPLLLEILRNHNGFYERAAHALAQMGCREAIPILLQHLDDYDSYAPLSQYKDERILPALKKAMPRLNRGADDPESGGSIDMARDAARLWIIMLECSDPLSKATNLASQLEGSIVRHDVLEAIAGLRDERAINLAVELLRNPKDWFDRGDAILILVSINSPKAIRAMIDAMGIDFNAKLVGKEGIGDNNEIYRGEIARRLKDRTSKDFGVDEAKWEAWYVHTYK